MSCLFTVVNVIKKMSFLRGSTNYVWCTTSVLGKGATGAVFQGVNKHNGEPVAVKTFNQLSHMRPHDVQIREFEVLKKVKHENIVKLLAIEEEQDGRGKVIVMELCTGGSLFNILDDPENTYGLQEEEFMLVLEHLSAGMKHLRDNNLVHRDLKPGNIMKFICDDGSTVYKLTDFGAARELEEDQQFMSLYGTEEYLHPDMYERAVLRKPVGKTFGATVDLWSIGVTLYHVATGNLPFRPYGGRRNKETMYYITTKKASGVISGTQSSENGPIDWCRSLPKGCQLSNGLKKYITPLLAGLLEVDTQKIWSFEKFFTEVTNILSRKRIHIFHIHKMQCIKIYFDPLEKYIGFKEELCEQTEVLPNNQILLFDNKHLNEIVIEETLGKEYPITTEETPIILFSNENNNVIIGVDNDLPKLPTFHNSVNVENDASVAKTICSISHACKRRIERFSLCSKLTHDSVAMFTFIVKQELLQVFLKSNRLLELAKYVEKATDIVMRSQRKLHSLLGVKTSSCVDWKAELEAGINQELVSGLNIAIKQLHSRFFMQDTLTKEWEKNSSGCRCSWKSKAPQRANTCVQRLRDSWQHMIRDRATRSLTYNDEQFHVLERMKDRPLAYRSSPSCTAFSLPLTLTMPPKRSSSATPEDAKRKTPKKWTDDDLVDYLQNPPVRHLAGFLWPLTIVGTVNMYVGSALMSPPSMDVMGNNLLKNLLEQEVMSSIINTADSLADWYKMAQTIYLQGKILDKDVDNSKKSLEKYFLRMDESDKIFYEESGNIGFIRPVAKKHGRKAIKGQDVRSFRTKICEIHGAQEDIYSLMKENSFLIETFQHNLTETLGSQK